MNTFDERLDSTADDLDQPTPVLVERLFDESDEPMVIVNATTQYVVAANPSAVTLLRTTAGGLVGSRLPSAFDAPSADTIDACLATAQILGSARSTRVRTRTGGCELTACLSLFRAGAESFILVRIDTSEPSSADQARARGGSLVCQTLDHADFGFLITDDNLNIDYANQTFVGMLPRSLQGVVVGSLLTDWLMLTESNLATMSEQLSQRQAVIRLSTRFRPHLIAQRRLEMYAVAVPDGRDSCWGFCLYDLPRLN